jgi:ABC-type glycerol-3-phosphate transport system substrate-binding protein
LRKLYLALLPALLLVLALGLAACGGGGESDEEMITSTIERSAISTDPAVCGETQTLNFMEQSSASNGKEAEKECEKETEEEDSNDPDSVNVSEVQTDGGTATANVEFEGGSFDQDTLEVALVEEDGDWKLDELTGFAKFDPKAFIAVFAAKLEEEPGIEPQAASCIVEGLEETPKDEIEALVIENNTQPVVELAESCE